MLRSRVRADRGDDERRRGRVRSPAQRPASARRRRLDDAEVVAEDELRGAGAAHAGEWQAKRFISS